MDKGQHLRLFITEGSGTTTDMVIGLATELSIHGSAQTESTTTKDSTDASGAVFDEYDITGRSLDINFTGLIASGTDSAAETFNDILSKVSDTPINWKIAMASGANNRTMGSVICYGQGKMTNIQATGQVDQQATYSGTIKNYGPVSVGS